MRSAALVVAAGRGLRVGGEVPKQFQQLAGASVLSRTLAALTAHPAVEHAVVVGHAEDTDLLAAAVAPIAGIGVTLAAGGATREASVRNGLAALPSWVEAVLIHDAARPLVTEALVGRVLDGLTEADGAAPGLAVSDALWRGEDGMAVAAVPRAGLWRAQTPQAFRLRAIRAAHAARAERAGTRSDDAPVADDVEVALAHGLSVAIVEGCSENLKITLPGDLARAEAILARRRTTTKPPEPQAAPAETRTGTGYDVHRFGPGRSVTLCGVEIGHDRALVGHSDADVGMHAITDAILGALAAGDIGRHFPPSDPRWKGAASRIFLAHAAALAGERGWRVAHADCTLICEAPKIGPHAEAMAAALAEILGIGAERVSVKATTSEGLGFTGRREGIAAMAAVTLAPSAPKGAPATQAADACG